MKIAIPVLGLLALLGIAYGLAFFGIIPVQKMADHSPKLAHALIALHLAKAKKPMTAAGKSAAPTAVSPEQEALNTQKKQLADAQAKLAKDRADFEAQQAAPTPSPASAASPNAASAASPNAASPASGPAPDTAGKLSAIYAAMSPDDLIPLFSKLPDPDVVSALMGLDEKKAGKVLAALPPARAARLTQEMSHPRPTSRAVASL